MKSILTLLLLLLVAHFTEPFVEDQNIEQRVDDVDSHTEEVETTDESDEDRALVCILHDMKYALRKNISNFYITLFPIKRFVVYWLPRKGERKRRIRPLLHRRWRKRWR